MLSHKIPRHFDGVEASQKREFVSSQYPVFKVLSVLWAKESRTVNLPDLIPLLALFAYSVRKTRRDILSLRNRLVKKNP